MKIKEFIIWLLELVATIAIGMVACIFLLVIGHDLSSFILVPGLLLGLIFLLIMSLRGGVIRRRMNAMAEQLIMVDHLKCKHRTFFLLLSFIIVTGFVATSFLTIDEDPTMIIWAPIGAWMVGRFTIFVLQIFRGVLKMDNNGVWHPLYGDIPWQDINNIEQSQVFRGKGQSIDVLLLQMECASELRQYAESRFIIGSTYKNDHKSIADDQVIFYFHFTVIPGISYAHAVATHLKAQHSGR